MAGPKSKSLTQSQSTQKQQGGTQSTQRRQSESQKKTSYSLPPARAEQLKKNCVNYILMAMNKNDTIKKSEIVNFALEKEGKALPKIWDDVVDTLKEVFGFVIYSDNFDDEGRKLKTIPDRFFVKVEEEDFSRNKQILAEKTAKMPMQSAKDVLLVQVLALILMKGDSCTEDALYKFVQRLNIDGRIGDFRKIINDEFCRGQYLIREVVDEDNPIVTYKWGFKAEVEISKEEVLKYVCKVMGKSPESFREQRVLIKNQEEYWRTVLGSGSDDRSDQDDQ